MDSEEIVLVGGHGDGMRIEIAKDQPYYVHRDYGEARVAAYTKTEIKADSTVSLKETVYTRRQINFSAERIQYYMAAENMTDLQAFLHLLANLVRAREQRLEEEGT